MTNIIVGVIVVILGIANIGIGVWTVAQEKKVFSVNFSHNLPNGNYQMVTDPIKETIEFRQADKTFATFKRSPNDQI